jgi:hypothetical protein
VTFVLFALGARPYAAHPEGVVELEQRRWTARAERVLLRKAPAPLAASSRP